MSSVAVTAEACATGRPVYLFDTGEGVTAMHDEPGDAGFRWPRSRDHWSALVYRLTMRFGPRRLTRDIRIVQQRLVDSGRAAWLGKGEPSAAPPPLRDLERAVARVRTLFQAAP